MNTGIPKCRGRYRQVMPLPGSERVEAIGPLNEDRKIVCHVARYSAGRITSETIGCRSSSLNTTGSRESVIRRFRGYASARERTAGSRVGIWIRRRSERSHHAHGCGCGFHGAGLRQQGPLPGRRHLGTSRVDRGVLGMRAFDTSVLRGRRPSHADPIAWSAPGRVTR
jgi:hypothetical protein